MKTNILVTTLLLIAVIYIQGCGKYSPTRIGSNKQLKDRYANEPTAPITVTLTSDNALAPDSHFSAFKQINLALTNTTSDSYTINGDSFSVSLASAESIQSQAPSIYIQHLVPCSVFLAGTFLFYWQACLPLALCSGIAGLCYSKTTNKKQENELRSLLLEPEESYTLPAKSSANFLLCIEKTNYKPKFSFSLQNNTTKTTTHINVHMRSQISTVFTTQ